MTTKISVNSFLDVVKRSGLLDAAIVDAYRSQSPDRLAYKMIEDGMLTQFQARQLVSGRCRGFFIGDKYKIVDALGKGGMGRVMLCEHLMLQRLVAVKLMFRSSEAKPGAIERFLQEARAAAKFDHPNLARVFDVDNGKQGPYIVMEYIDGANLHELVAKHGRLSPQRAANYIRQAAQGLQQAHLSGLVHRDIKPGNFMLDRNGRIKLLDLGLARFYDASPDEGLTSAYNPNAVLGTADFIAPEQALDCSRADIRADIYSLGCTLYFLLLRALPAGEGTTMQKLLRHQSQEPEPIRVKRPEVPEALAAIVERMMKKDPDARFQTPVEVATALAPFTGDKFAAPKSEEMPPVRLVGYKTGMTGSRSFPSMMEAERATTTSMASASESTDVDPLGFPSLSGASLMASALEMNSSSSNPGGATTGGNGESSPVPASLSDAGVPGEVNAGLLGLSRTTLMAIGTAVAALLLVCFMVLWPILNMPSSVSNDYLNTPNKPRRTARFDQPVEPPPATTPTAPTPNSTLPPPTPLPPPTKTATKMPTKGTSNSTVVPPPTEIKQPHDEAPAFTLRGGGSTMIKPMMEHWAALYEKQTRRKIEYTGAGSSKGVEGVLNRFLDFGCSDAPLTEKQINEAGVLVQHVPLVMGAVVPTFNLTNERGEPLKIRFTGPLLANIFLGKVKKWNDPAFSANNPGVNFPDMDIQVAVRKDGSGTTNIWTDYLSKASSDFKAKVGVGNTVSWPTGAIKAEKNAGVADVVSRTVGSIGYVELSYALQNSLPVGPVRNKQGTYVMASVETITAAAAGSAQSIPDDLRYSLTDADGINSYPIVGTCWAMVCADLPDDKRKEVIDFLLWATAGGQDHVAALKYGRLPPELAGKVQDALKKIRRGTPSA